MEQLQFEMLFGTDKLISSVFIRVLRKPFSRQRSDFQTTIWQTRYARRRDDAISATTTSTSRYGTVVGAFEEMNNLLADGMRNTSTTMYDEFVSKSMKELSVSKLSTFVRISGKKSFNKTFCHLQRNLPAVSKQLKSISKSRWLPADMARIVYGLQCLEETDDGYLSIIRFIMF